MEIISGLGRIGFPSHVVAPPPREQVTSQGPLAVHVGTVESWRGVGDEGETTHDGQCCTGRQSLFGIRWVCLLVQRARWTTPLEY